MSSPAPSPLHNRDGSLSLRDARPGDARAIGDLAALEAAATLRRPVMVAVEDGRVIAALSLADGRVVADPFVRTAGAVALLRLRAAGRHAGSVAPRRRFLGLRRPGRLVVG